VRVTFSDGEQLVSSDVTVEGDSIHYWERAKQTSYSKVWVSSPLDRVSVVEARQGDSAKTGGLVGVILAVTIVAVALIATSDMPLGN